MPRIIGVELRLNVTAGPHQVNQELLLIPMDIELPSPSSYHEVQFEMPCTIHTSFGDLNLGGRQVGQLYEVPLIGYEMGRGPRNSQEIAAAISRGVNRLR